MSYAGEIVPLSEMFPRNARTCEEEQEVINGEQV